MDEVRGRKPSTESLAALVADDMQAVNALIIDRMQSQVSLIPQLAGHLVAAGGKRIRPMLTLAAARMCGYSGRAPRRTGHLRGVHPYRDPAP